MKGKQAMLCKEANWCCAFMCCGVLGHFFHHHHHHLHNKSFKPLMSFHCMLTRMKNAVGEKQWINIKAGIQNMRNVAAALVNAACCGFYSKKKSSTIFPSLSALRLTLCCCFVVDCLCFMFLFLLFHSFQCLTNYFSEYKLVMSDQDDDRNYKDRNPHALK